MKQHASAKGLIDKELRKLRDACTKRKEQGDARIEYNNRDLQGKSDAGDFDAVKRSKSTLMVLGQFHTMRGSFAINAEKDPEGWKQFDLGARYAYWEVKMALAARLRALKTGEHSSKLTIEVDYLALLLCYSYVLGLADEFNELRRFWGLVTSLPGLTMREEQGEKVSKWRNVKPDGFVYSYGHFDRFVTHLFGGPRFGPPFELYDEVERLTLGDYQEVVDAWSDEGERFAAALIVAADFHARNIDNTHNLDLQLPFNHPLCSLVPWEMASIYKLRDAEGLQTPKIEHPLMNLPAASLAPRQVSPIDDPIFDQMDELYNDNCRIEDYL